MPRTSSSFYYVGDSLPVSAPTGEEGEGEEREEGEDLTSNQQPTTNNQQPTTNNTLLRKI
ncbi:MAG: hypothetical protein AB4290_29245 [Spirulina sp.]